MEKTPKTRYFISLAYHGAAYHGWQRQPGAISVQEAIEERMKLLLRQEVCLVTAGRTDAGVHARKTFAHFDGPPDLDTDWLTHRLNSFLPADIAVRYVLPMPAGAHARYDAVQRTYNYLIIDRKDPFLADRAWRLSALPDVERMNRAAEILFQYKDFQSFSKVKTDVKTFLCRIDEAKWERRGKHELVFRISADRFLRGMVRALVGTMVEIGQGKREVGDMHRILQARDRRAAGPAAPAKGLFLTDVRYKPQLQSLIEGVEGNVE